MKKKILFLYDDWKYSDLHHELLQLSLSMPIKRKCSLNLPALVIKSKFAAQNSML